MTTFNLSVGHRQAMLYPFEMFKSVLVSLKNYRSNICTEKKW